MQFGWRVILLSLFAAVSSVAQTYSIRTFAGGGVPENIPATSAGLGLIGGIALDASGNLYMSLPSFGIVVRKGADGMLTRVAGSGITGSLADGGPATEAQLCSCLPFPIAVAPDGTLYIGDALNRRIRKVSNGTISTVIGGGSRPLGATETGSGFFLEGASALTFDENGTLYFIDGGNIAKISNGNVTRIGSQARGAVGYMTVGPDGGIYVSTGGNIFKFINATSSSLFQSASGGLASDSQGAIYFSDGGKVQKLGVAGSIVGTGTPGFSGDGGPAPSAQLQSISGIAFDRFDNLYVVDGGNQRVRKVTNGVISTVAGATAGALIGDNGPAVGSQVYADATVVGKNGTVFIADRLRNRVRAVSPGGVITTIAGTGNAAFGGDNGPAVSAQLSSPQGIALDSDGNLYISDTGNHRVRKISNGVITTFAGTGIAGHSGDGSAATEAQLNFPVALTFNKSGDLLIAERGDGTLRKVSNGVISTVSSTCCANSFGLAVDSDDNIYVANFSLNRIIMIAGNTVTTVATIDHPVAVATTTSGQLIVSNQSQIYTLNGGVLSPIAGGAPVFRDGVSARATSLVGGFGLAAGNSGEIYVTDNNRIRVLTPTSSTCVTTADIPAILAPVAGGAFPVHVQTDPACTWFVSGLPAWIACSEPTLGTGSGSFTLTVDANNGPGRSATIATGDSGSIAVNQPDGCALAELGYSGQTFSDAPATLSLQLAFSFPQCSWTITNIPTWLTVTPTSGIGFTNVNVSVAQNLGAARTATLNIRGTPYIVEQGAASIPGSALVGSLAQVVSNGNWHFLLDAVNLGASTVQTRLNFRGDAGQPQVLPWMFPQAQQTEPLNGSTFDRSINPNAQLILDTTADNGPSSTGWGELLASGSIGAFGIFSQPFYHWDAVVPLETRNASKYILAFDNTGPLATGIAAAKVMPSVGDVSVIIRDENGTQIGTGIVSLSGGQGHRSFMLNDTLFGFPVTNGRRGTIEFDTPAGGQISVLGLRANGPALTTLPVLASGDSPGGAIAHIAYNGGFTSVFYVVNTGTSPASFTLSFFDDKGDPLTVPLFLPQSATAATTAVLTRTLGAGAMLLVETQANDATASVTGSAQLTTAGNISGFEIFRWTTYGQEASVPLETRSPRSFVLVFDDTNGLTTGVALANQNTAAVAVTAKIYDDTGALLQTASINLAAHEHTSFLLPDVGRFPVTANKRGMVEFVVPQGGRISTIGLRAKADGTLTTIPVLAK